MSHQAQAVVSDGRGSCHVETVTVEDPAPGEVLVALRASGVCHTDHDLLCAPIPLVLGHEGAGVVAAVGEGVSRVQEGQRVLLSWAIPCLTCFQCDAGNHHLCERQSPLLGLGGHAHLSGTRRADGSTVIRAFSLGTLSTLTLVRADAVVPLPDHVPFTAGCIVGCGVMTGYGSVVNAAAVEPGSSVVVLGCGGVGLNVVQAARISGARRIIAVDPSGARRDFAAQLGATDLLDPAPDDTDLSGIAGTVASLTDGRGADYAFECTGVPRLGAAPLAMVRHGGTAVQVSGIEESITVDMRLFEWDKTYINPLYGQCRPTRDFPRIFDHYARGELLLDELVTTTYALADAHEAFADMLSGVNAKGVVVFE